MNLFTEEIWIQKVGEDQIMKGFIQLVNKFRLYPISKKEGSDIQKRKELASVLLDKSLTLLLCYLFGKRWCW